MATETSAVPSCANPEAMDDISIFTDKENEPTTEDLKRQLGTSFSLWMSIEKRVDTLYPNGIKEWNYPGKKYGGAIE